MVSNSMPLCSCRFCGEKLRLKYGDVFHPFKPDHGPFYIYVCTACGSSQTDPLPSPDSLAALYGSFQDGLPNLHRTITADDPQNAIYSLCLNRITSITGRKKTDMFLWLDVGAGGGEFSYLMSSTFPSSQGVAVDLHACPTALESSSSTAWHQRDINQPNFSVGLQQFDLVVSISVWEHVLRPDLFVSNLLRLVRPGGMLYLLCPNNNSLASRVLGHRWPYFIPGEHLAMPSPLGATRCIQREWTGIYGTDQNVKINVQPIMLPYTFRYVLRRLGVEHAGRLMPPGWGLPLPVGALEAIVSVQNKIGHGVK